MTIDYYNKHAREFCNNTIDVDLSAIYHHFCCYLNSGDRILDAGCGSGRDIIAFMNMGYIVDAFDLSPEIARIAEYNSGINVPVSRFEDYETSQPYDAIWCCASLLHVPLNELTSVMRSLSRSLKKNGIWYVSFKYGDQESMKDGRYFTNLNKETLTDLIQQVNSLEIIEIWITEDVRPARTDKWLNAILQKKIEQF